ncbi:RluA family pseudouridine synthase [Weissella paramesenteroides]|uniref:RluA family pseudouridine synthase n=1 Tax=Weissella paramesenteroides TaxID=1249 RepID=UPI001238C586|nr:RluA family pseudouridine synthase [Weissella paramesenteroides]KAA8446820.1 RluA family pseudouridine synthase [Weissella paramesenteroides]KAA8454286.1 RluA family pseudouridine synthase [Weissella paramesenteroides]
MAGWTKTITLPADQPAISIKEQLTDWRIPRRIRGNFRMARRLYLNGQYQPTSTILKPYDVLTLNWLPEDFITPDSQYVPDASQSLQVLYENDELMVVNKSKGVKTHPNSPGENGTMMNFAQAYLMKQNKRAYMVHRLDGQTTGALIIAKVPYVVPILNQMLHDKTIKRTYLAWVDGHLIDATGTIMLAIGDHPTNSRLRQINGPNAKPAVTHWTKIKSVYQQTLVRLQLETGRTHQIRLHMAAIGHPLVGDDLYNQQSTYEEGLLLHSANVQLPIPFSNEIKSIGAPLPTSFPVNLK